MSNRRTPLRAFLDRDGDTAISTRVMLALAGGNGAA